MVIVSPVKEARFGTFDHFHCCVSVDGAWEQFSEDNWPSHEVRRNKLIRYDSFFLRTKKNRTFCLAMHGMGAKDHEKGANLLAYRLEVN